MNCFIHFLTRSSLTHWTWLTTSLLGRSFDLPLSLNKIYFNKPLYILHNTPLTQIVLTHNALSVNSDFTMIITPTLRFFSLKNFHSTHLTFGGWQTFLLQHNCRLLQTNQAQYDVDSSMTR